MKQALLLLALVSGVALASDHHQHNNHHQHPHEKGHDHGRGGNSRGSVRRSRDVVQSSLPVASVTNCESLSAASHPPVQCQRGHHGPHVAQIFGNMCYALQSGFRERECTVMSPHHEKSARSHSHAHAHGHGHNHNHGHQLVKKQRIHGDRHHSMSGSSSSSSDSSSSDSDSSKSRRSKGRSHHHHWRSRALRGNSLDGRRRAQFCIALYNPVTCLLDGVEFPSRCDAVSAGYDEADCTVPTQPVGDCPTTVSNPVVCTGDQSFDNICLASEAGFVPSKDCVSANQPLFAEDKCAGRRTKPVMCGTEQRVFSNICLARAAGFKKSSCEKVQDPPV